MLFYNPESKECLSYVALCQRLHASIPKERTEVTGWHRLRYDEHSSNIPDGYEEVQGEIAQNEAGEYVQKWTVVRTQARLAEELFEELRAKRNRLLAETDYLLMPDYELDCDTRQMVIEYRRALRDITDVDGAPWDGGGKQTPWPRKEW